jgi:hypothetical protein
MSKSDGHIAADAVRPMSSSGYILPEASDRTPCGERTMSEKKKSFTIPIFGLLFGVVISSMTGEWWWVGVGFAVGLAVEAARARRK